MSSCFGPARFLSFLCFVSHGCRGGPFRPGSNATSLVLASQTQKILATSLVQTSHFACVEFNSARAWFSTLHVKLLKCHFLQLRKKMNRSIYVFLFFATNLGLKTFLSSWYKGFCSFVCTDIYIYIYRFIIKCIRSYFI